MKRTTRWTVMLAATAAIAPIGAVTLLAQGRAGGAGAGGGADQSVPADLKPLLLPHHSEMRLILTRYDADRRLLMGNYAGGGGRGAGGGRGGGRGAAAGRGGGAGPAAPDPNAVPAATVSDARIAHLEGFDLAWQQALEHIAAASLTPEAQTDRTVLLGTIKTNLAELDADAATMNQDAGLVPFEPDLVGILEDRILRHVDMTDPENVARKLTAITASVATIRARLDSGSSGTAGLRANRVQALGAAGAVDALRGNLTQWFTFYNGYDPLFTWWMGVPHHTLDTALTSYSAFLRDHVASANETSNLTVAAKPIRPDVQGKYNEVPDLHEILTLPQDEMTAIVDRYSGRGAGGRGGGGRGGAGPTTHDSAYYNAWLGALKSIDFDHLTRNAQVDYLYIRANSERELSRVGVVLPANPPRKQDNSGIPGAARGREGLIWDLQDQFIPYTPEQLIVLANREYDWCVAEMKKASREMGYGDNWKAALEKTKTMHVPPGGQPKMIRDLMEQAVVYLRAHDLVTVPEVDRESQPMVMMTPQQQLASPFFLGGSQIMVSYPTDAMDFEAREESMRGNNRPWSHATAFHEMIPGHNMAGYYEQRYADYRAPLASGGPFWTEGWAVYWELTLYDMGFDMTPEERVGALFWRMHRCARIIFSLKFHMGQWSPQQAIDFLVDSVGHEPANARAEVLRSFQGGYGPLYQAGYLLGAIQLRSLRHDVVDSKQMTSQAFDDEILRINNEPIALVRLAFSKQKLTRDMPIDWKFYGDLPEK